MRINKLLSNYGYCSRKVANDYILAGRVRVHGHLATPGQWVEKEDLITLDGVLVTPKTPCYFLYHKPPGVVCTHDEKVPGNILTKLSLPSYAFPVGRLDKASQGLLLLTNDGDLCQWILQEAHEVEKTYEVTLDKPLEEAHLQALSLGVDISIGITKPCTIQRVGTHSFHITLTQGMNRQIRRMVKVFGYDVVKLFRFRLHHLTLEDLKEGALRPLTKEEVQGFQGLLHL